MSHHRAFTLAELAFTFVVVGLIAALALPMLRSSRTGCGRCMQSSTQVRGIIQGLITLAPNYNDFYAGITSEGIIDTRPIPALTGNYGTRSTSGAEPVYRLALMLKNALFTPEYAISPSETNPTKIAATLDPSAAPASALGNVTARNLSFAMLRIDDAAGEGRRGEWKSTTNSKAVVVSDRNIVSGAGASARSIHDEKGSIWRGSVGYNDNHVNFETTNRLTGTSYVGKPEVAADDLFADDVNAKGDAGFDAGMVHQDATSYLNQN